MRSVRNLAFLGMLTLGCQGLVARADIVFSTESTATQQINSPLLGGTFTLVAHGPQTFDIDLATGTASVTSAFKGSDFPDPFEPSVPFTYDLYNTATTGTVTQVGSMYDVSFSLLFELKLTSGPLAGLTFETLDNATFAASNIPTIPFPAGTSFSDPMAPMDAVNIYVKYDPTFTFPVGTLAGYSFDRVVTINEVVPELSSFTLAASLAALTGLGLARRRRRAGCTS